MVIGARIAASAGASEVLVSSTVKDLTAGSGLAFEDVGERELKGVPDRWRSIGRRSVSVADRRGAALKRNDRGRSARSLRPRRFVSNDYAGTSTRSVATGAASVVTGEDRNPFTIR